MADMVVPERIVTTNKKAWEEVNDAYHSKIFVQKDEVS